MARLIDLSHPLEHGQLVYPKDPKIEVTWDRTLHEHGANVSRLVMGSQDSAYVAFSDAAELETVKTNFLKKKLGLTESDEALDAALDEVKETMKADRTKSRITVYYLLAEKFGKLSVFH